MRCIPCRSVAPTAFTGYSFHVVEAAIVFANEILVCFLFPIHIGVHRLYHLFTTVIHNGVVLQFHLTAAACFFVAVCAYRKVADIMDTDCWVTKN